MMRSATDHPDRHARAWYRVGFLWWAALLLLSAIYYRERATFLDLAFHLFEIVRTGGHSAVQNHRFVALLTQWVPMLGVRAGLSLPALMLAYSLAFPVLYLGVYVACGAMRQYRIGLAWLLGSTLFATHAFFWIQSELPQGLAVLTIMLAALLWQPQRNAAKALRIALLAIGLPTLAFSHPLMVFPFMGLLTVLWFHRQDARHRVLVAASAVVFVGAYFVKARFFATTYDSNAMQSASGILHNLLYINKLASTKFLVHKWLSWHILLPLAIVACSMLYRRQRRSVWQWLAWTLPFAAYLLLIVLANADASTPDFYRENLLLPLGMLVAVPLVLALPAVLPRRWMALAFAGVLVFATVRFVAIGRQYEARMAWLQSFCERNAARKLIFKATDDVRNAITFNWATPYECWLISTTAPGGHTASLIIHDNPQDVEWATHDPGIFLTTWGAFPYADLPQRYFRLPDTAGTYCIVPTTP